MRQEKAVNQLYDYYNNNNNSIKNNNNNVNKYRYVSYKTKNVKNRPDSFCHTRPKLFFSHINTCETHRRRR